MLSEHVLEGSEQNSQYILYFTVMWSFLRTVMKQDCYINCKNVNLLPNCGLLGFIYLCIVMWSISELLEYNWSHVIDSILIWCIKYIWTFKHHNRFCNAYIFSSKQIWFPKSDFVNKYVFLVWRMYNVQLGQFSVNPPRLLLEVGRTSTLQA